MNFPSTILDALLPRKLGPAERLTRDLQWLLNTRCEYPHFDGSVMSDALPGYGLPADAAALASIGGLRLAELCEMIAAKLRAFEPRLQSVRVTVDRAGPPTVLLRIEATLPAPRAPVFVAAALLWPDGSFDVQRELAS